jgi:hypothetical protein
MSSGNQADFMMTTRMTQAAYGNHITQTVQARVLLTHKPTTLKNKTQQIH